MESAEDVITELIRQRSIYKGSITRALSLYHDLRLYGDDAYEILVALHDRFGTSFKGFNFTEYFPGEGVFGDFFAWRAREKRPRLTVGHLIGVVERGQWVEPTLS